MKNIFMDSEWPAWKAQAKFFKIQTIVTTLNKKMANSWNFHGFLLFFCLMWKGKTKSEVPYQNTSAAGFW